ncbi:MAG: hypothetical protein JHD16_11575 [Solirubrobacteraceae bacterium]|nr:hypothetical protein [Solirubrobacteraceae bacterium]
MSGTNDPNQADAELLGDLASVLARTDAVPGHVVDAAYAAFETRDLEAQLAVLLRDSAADGARELAGVRGASTRLLTFSVGEERFVEVDIDPDGERRTLTGYVVPSEPGELVVEHAGGQTTAGIDAHGRFSAALVPSGPVRLRVTLPGVRPILTEWMPV